MFGLFKAKDEPCVNLSRVAVTCSLRLRDDFQQIIPPNTGFFTSTIPFFALAHNFVFFMAGKRYGPKILDDVQKAIRGSASLLSEVMSNNMQGRVTREQIGQVFATELESSRPHIFECLEQSDTDADAAIRGVCILLLQKIGIAEPDQRTLENSMEVMSACFSSAIASLKAEYKP